jgi:hypothetical protein
MSAKHVSYDLFSSSCQRQCELLPSLGVRRLTMFRFIWQNGFRKEDFFKSAYQKKELPMVAMFVNGSGQNEQSL